MKDGEGIEYIPELNQLNKGIWENNIFLGKN